MGLLYDKKKEVAPTSLYPDEKINLLKQGITNPYDENDPRGFKFSPTFQSIDKQSPTYTEEEQKLLDSKRGAVDQYAYAKNLEDLVYQSKGVNDEMAKAASEQLYQLTGKRIIELNAVEKAGSISASGVGAVAQSIKSTMDSQSIMSGVAIREKEKKLGEIQVYKENLKSTDPAAFEEYLKKQKNIGNDEFFDSEKGLTSELEKIKRNKKIFEFISKYANVVSDDANARINKEQNIINDDGSVNWQKLKNPSAIFQGIAQGLGSSAPILLVGFLTKGQSLVPSMVAAAAVEKGDAFQQYSQDMSAEKYNGDVEKLSDEELKKIDDASTAYGVLMALPEAALSRLLKNNVEKKFIGGWLKKLFIQAPKDAAIAMGTEGTTEYIQKTLQNGIERISGIDPDKDITQGSTGEGLLGALGGGAVGYTSTVMQAKASVNIDTVPGNSEGDPKGNGTLPPPPPGDPKGNGTLPPPPPGDPTAGITKYTQEEAAQNFQQLSEIAPAAVNEKLMISLSASFTPAEISSLSPEEKSTLVTMMDSATHYPTIDEAVVEKNIQAIEATGVTSAVRQNKTETAAVETPTLTSTPTAVETGVAEDTISHDASAVTSNVVARALKVDGKTTEQVIEDIKTMPAEVLDALIEKVQKETRKEMGLMVSTEGKGVTRRAVTDGNGNLNFIASDFSLAKAKAQSKREAEANKKYTHELLYENDPLYAAMIDQQADLTEERINNSTDEAELDAIIDTIFSQGESISNNIQKYEADVKEQEVLAKAEESVAKGGSKEKTSTKESTKGKSSKTKSSSSSTSNATKSTSRSKRTASPTQTSSTETKTSKEADTFQLQSVEREKAAAEQGALNLGVDRNILSQPATGPTMTSKEYQEAQAKNVAEKKTGQKELVMEAISEEGKSIKQIAEETKIKEPNVRRILGVGAKEGVFSRVDKGVYVLSKNGKDIAYIETGSATESLPRLAANGFKADMIFLDIPYSTSGVKGGNRGINYNTLSLEDFTSKIIPAIQKIAKTADSAIVYMYSNSKTGWNQMVKYNQAIQNSGLSLIAKGTYSKTYKDGKPMKFGKYPMPPEGILIFNKSGKEVKLPNGFDIQAVAPLYKGHYQTEKAAVLLRAIIDGTTKVGDMVLDPFSGSGVTLDEAIKSGRFAYGIEQSTEAVEKHIKPRLEKSAEEDVMANISTTDFGVETFLASKEVVALVDKFKQTVNPNIRELLRWEILKMYKDENGNTLEGYFRRSDMTIGTVLEMPYEKVLGVLREEVGHAAFSLMSSKERQQIVDWYKQLSERDLVNIFGKKTLGAYRLQNKDNDFDMADEAIQWAMRNKEFYTDSKIVKKVKAAIKKLLVLLNKITKGLLFTKTIEKIDTRNDAFSLFGEVFSQTGGETFARSVGFKEELFARQGGTAGHIIFKDGENYADKGKIMASIKKTEEAILKEVETKKKESSSFRSILKLYAQKYQELTGVPMPASFAETLSDRYIANIMRNQKKEGLVEGTQIARQKSLQQQAKLRKILTERIERKNRIKNARTVDRKDIAVYSAKEKLNEKIAEKNKTIAEKKEFMKLAVDNITQMLPPSERGRNGLLARVTKIKNLDELNTLIKDVWEARDAYEIRTKKEADIKAKRAERTALYAQELRDRLTKFKDTVKSWDERRALLRKYVRSTFPIGANLKQFLNAIGRSKTDEHVQQIIEKVDSVRRDYERKQTQKEIKRLLKYNKNAKKYTALKKFPIKIRMEIEKIAAGYKSASLNELIRMRNDIYAYRLLGKKMMDANQAIHDMNVDNRLTMLEESGGINLDSYDPKLELNSEARGAIKLLQKMKKQINTGAIYMFTVDRILDVIGGSDHYNSPLFQIFKTSLDIKRHDADNATDFNIKFFWGMVNAKGLTGMATPGILKQYITGKLNLDGTLKKHEWSNAERIMIHATRVQEHGSDIEYGRNLLINQGLSEETIDSVVLNEEEMTMYNFMRERFDAIHPALAEEYMRTHNELLPFIKNYFPIMTDFNSSGGVNAFHDALSQDYRRASVKFGSLESRVGGFERPLQMDSFKVYETYMKRANYWLHMNASLKDLNELNNNERFIAKYGKLAHNYIAEYLDVVARMGSITGQEYHPIIDAIRTNFSVYTLGLRPTSQMIQYLAWINGSAEIGLPYATKGVGYILQDEWRKFAFNNSSELRNRTGHDIALRDATNRGYTDRVSELSMAPTAFGDKNTAGAIWTGAYKKSLDEQGKTMDFEHPDQIALNYANLSVRLTQGSTDYKDLPQILRGKNRSWMKVAFMFQSFTLSSISNYMMHDIGGYVTKQDKARTAQQITLMATAFLAEAGLRAAIAIAVANMVGDDKELDKRKKENLFMSAIINAMNSMPGLSQASNVIQYGNNPVPLAAFFQKYAGAAHQSVSAGTAKGQQKAWLQFITMNAGVYYGLPLDYVEKLVEKIVF